MRLLADVNAAVEIAYRPNWRQPREHEGPTRRPGREVVNMPEDERAVVAMAARANGERDDSGEGEDEVHYHRDGLEFVDYSLENCGEDAVEKNGCKECAVDGTICGGPVTVADDDNEREEHEGETVVDGAEAADQAQGIGVANEETERPSRLWRCEEMRPPVKASRRRHCGSEFTLETINSAPKVVVRIQPTIAIPTRKMKPPGMNQP